MAIQGLRDTEGFLTNARPQNWREGIMLLFPNGMAPLTALTSVMKSKSTDDPRYNWFEKVMDDQRLTLTANLTASGTNVTVSSGASSLKDGHLLLVEETNEIMLVNGDPSSDTSFTVIRGYAGTSGVQALVDYDGAGVNPKMTIIGSAYEEGSDSPTAVAFDPREKYNYTQIFRNTLEITRTAMKTRLRTGEAVKEAKREALLYHTLEMEKAFWFGERSQTTRNGKPLRTTRGLVNWIGSGNDLTWGSSAQGSESLDLSGNDLEAFEAFLSTVFDYGSSEKMCWTGNKGMLNLQQLVRKNADYQLVQGQKEFGMNVNRFVTPFGELVLKTHPLFNRMKGGSDYASWNSNLVILDMENVMYRYFTGDDTRYEEKLEDNGIDGKKSGYISEAGLEVHQPETHFILREFNAASADS